MAGEVGSWTRLAAACAIASVLFLHVFRVLQLRWRIPSGYGATAILSNWTKMRSALLLMGGVLVNRAARNRVQVMALFCRKFRVVYRSRPGAPTSVDIETPGQEGERTMGRGFRRASYAAPNGRPGQCMASTCCRSATSQAAAVARKCSHERHTVADFRPPGTLRASP